MDMMYSMYNIAGHIQLLLPYIYVPVSLIRCILTD